MGDNMITGNWMNINTGEIITVANSVMDEKNQMILMTNKGQMTFDEFSQNYIQCEDTDQTIQVPQESVGDDFLIDDIPVTNQLNKTSTVNVEETKTNSLIEDIFNKIDKKPNIQISLNWDEFPVNDIKTLTKYLNLTVEDIAEYIVTKYVNKETIALSVKDYLNSLL